MTISTTLTGLAIAGPESPISTIVITDPDGNESTLNMGLVNSRGMDNIIAGTPYELELTGFGAFGGFGAFVDPDALTSLTVLCGIKTVFGCGRNIISDTNNTISLIFTGVDLTAFDRVDVTFGDDTRNTDEHQDSVMVISATELLLNFNDTTEVLPNYWRVVGYNSIYTAGAELVSQHNGNLPPSSILK